MHRLPVSYLSWLTLAVAIVLWVGVGFAAWTISHEESARTVRMTQEEEESIQQAAMLRLHMLARETRGARTELENIAHRDVVEILDLIEGAGRDAGISVKIGESLSADSTSDAPFGSATFVVEASGTFAQVVHAAALFESLPAPSSLPQLG